MRTHAKHRETPFLATIAVLVAVFIHPASALAKVKPVDPAQAAAEQAQILEQTKRSARVGSPHAQFTLANVYYQGEGATPDKLKAFVWMSLATEYGYPDAAKLAKMIFQELDQAQQQQATALLEEYIGNYGKAALETMLLPKVIKENLGYKVRFARVSSRKKKDKERLDPAEYLGDDYPKRDIRELEDRSIMCSGFRDRRRFGFGLARRSYNFSGGTYWGTSYGEDRDYYLYGRDFFTQGSYFGAALPICAQRYFLNAEFDIAPDGTTRNIDMPFSYGLNSRRAIRKVRHYKFEKPTFKGEPVYFSTRIGLGNAGLSYALSKFSIYDRYPRLGRLIRKNKRNVKTGNAIDLYNYALTLIYIPGLRREPNAVEELLTAAAEQGFDEAQFILGMKLYREQKDPEMAVRWIVEAAKQGLANAEYRLGKILLESPWFERDERKAAFWLNRAAKQGYVYALRDMADLHLFAQTSNLHNAGKALTYLTRIERVDRYSPETFYSLAIAHKKDDDKRTAIKKLKKAIYIGNQLGRDVREWKTMLGSWQAKGVVEIEEL